jgi:predicted transcriptional regulator
MRRERKFGENFPLRLADEAQDRLASVAEEIRSKRGVVGRALILDGIGLADPITAEVARLAREAAERVAARTA